MKDVELFTVQETARLLRVSVPTIYRWVRLGVLDSRKLGRKRLITKGAIERALREGVQVKERW